MEVDWFKCVGDVWCELKKVDVNHEFVSECNGVYIIWSGKGNERVILKVGSGNIKEHILASRGNLAIKAFEYHGLYITWAEISPLRRTGVELYLLDTLEPRIIEDVPTAIKAKVNLPWDDD
ncbi:MAG: hypothetical protein ACLFQX_09315 [Candidatus Kapaibacterium sp.]